MIQTSSSSITRRLLISGLFAVTLSAFADVADKLGAVGVGDPPPEISLDDQHDRLLRIDSATKMILFAPDRTSGEIAYAALEPVGDEALDDAGIRYIADISGMPGFVTRMFALPKMRDYSFSVLLATEEADAAALPSREGHVTVLKISDGRVADVAYFADATALAAAIGLD